MAKKTKVEPIDGLSAKDVKRIRSAVRQVWSWSYMRRLVVKRCAIENDMSRCEQCKAKVPKIYVDHMVPCGDVDEGFIERTFVSSIYLQGLCKKCHAKKTKAERDECW